MPAQQSAPESRPKVLQLGNFYPPYLGGVQEVLRLYAQILARQYDVTALVHSTDRRTHREMDGDIKVVRVATVGRIRSQCISPAMALELVCRRYDVVHFHYPQVWGCLLLLLFQRHAKLIVTHHSEITGFGFLGKLCTTFYRRLLRRAAAITVLARKNLLGSPAIAGENARHCVVPYSVDATKFALVPHILTRADELRRLHSGGRPVVSTVGRLVQYKGVDILLRAVARIGDVSCFIVGDGPERAKLEALAAQLGIERRCTFFGSVSEEEKHALLRSSDVFVLPSRSAAEAFGISQVEAQLCGVPIVASNLPTGVTDVTVCGVTGLCFTPENVDELAAALATLVGDAQLRARYGQAGYDHAMTLFSPEHVRQQLLDLYEEVLGRGGGGTPSDRA